MSSLPINTNCEAAPVGELFVVEYFCTCDPKTPRWVIVGASFATAAEAELCVLAINIDNRLDGRIRFRRYKAEDVKYN